MRRLNDITIEVTDGVSARKPRSASRPRRNPRRLALRRRFSFLRTRRAQRIALAAVLTAVFLGVPSWLTLSESGRDLIARTQSDALDFSARAGLRVADVYVAGRARTPKEALVEALSINRGDPILGIDLKATRERLEKIPRVETATLERRLPGEIHLVITERHPVALWQNQGHYYLIDATGLVVGDETDGPQALPLVVGEGAPDHAAALLGMLTDEPSLKARVKAAQWISGRRWDLTLDAMEGGIVIRLPENDPAGAIHELVRLDREQGLLERKITLIDMRLPDRLVLRGEHGAAPAGQSGTPSSKLKSLPGKDT